MRPLNFARPIFCVLLILTSGLGGRLGAQTPPASCERMTAQSLPDTTINVARL